MVSSRPVLGCAACAWILRASRCDERCALNDRGCHRQWWERRSARATATRAVAKSGEWSEFDSDPHDLPDLATLAFVERSHGPVIDDQDNGAIEHDDKISLFH